MKDDFKLGQYITHEGVTGYVTFISDNYLTYCIKEKPISDESAKSSRRKKTQVNVLIFRSEWGDVATTTRIHKDNDG